MINRSRHSVMYPFEVWDENTQRIEFYWDRWSQFRGSLFNSYPVDRAHSRIETSLYFPSDRLEDVWVHNWNPHHEIGNYHLSVHDCFYSEDWSIVFDVYPGHDHSQLDRGWDNWRVFIEEGHNNPWGEPIRIMSTSANISDNSSHRFAYFRGKYWKLISWVPCHTGHVFEWDTEFMFEWDTDLIVPHADLDDVMLDGVTLEDLFRSFWSPQKTQVPKVNWIKEGF